MSSHYEISREAGALRKNKQFAEALELFKQLFEEYKDECNEFDWWGYAQCLLKLDHYHESLKVSEEGSHKYPDSEYIRNIYHWSLYHVVIKPEPVNDRQEFFNAVDEITLNSDPANKYSPFVRTIFTAIDVLELNYNENASGILNLISKLQPELLDQESFTFTAANGKQVQTAPDYEKYHAILVRALFENGRYDECIAAADKALTLFDRFHHGNDVWIRRMKALSLYKKGLVDESLAEYQWILSRKKDWFLKKEMAEILCEKGEYDKALVVALDASDDPGKDQMKVNLFMLVANIFKTKGLMREAAVHARLVNAVRQSQGWSADIEAENILLEYKQADELPAELNKLQQMAEIIWEEYQPAPERLTGEIARMLPHGNAGFIKTADNNSYYFKIRDVAERNLLPVVGMKVSFIKSESFDPVHNQPSVIAAEIRRVV